MERRRDFWNSFKYVLEYAKERKPDLLLISGDLYDRVNPRNPPRTHLLKYFRFLFKQGVHVFLIGGHHDTPRSVEEGASPLDELAASGYVYFLRGIDEMSVEHVKIGDVDVCVSGVTYNFALGRDDDPLERTKPRAEGDVNILMLHYPIEGFTRTYMLSEPLVRLSNIGEEINYVAAGHLHQHQERMYGSTFIAYPGSTERKSFLEEKDDVKGFLWVELGEEGVEDKKFIEVPARLMKTLTYTLSSESTSPSSDIVSYALQHKNEELILRLKISGRVPLDVLTKYRRDEIIRKLLDHFFFVVIDDESLVYRIEKFEPMKWQSPLEAYEKYVDKLIQEEKDSQRRKILEIAKEMVIEKLVEIGAW